MEYKKVGLSSPSITPKASERTKNGDSNGTSRHDKEKGVNVQVLLRCRPFNEDELKANVPQVINCNEQRREVSVYQSTASKNIDRTFTFDKVFGPNSQQSELYDQAIVPIVNEVLDGYNCTIFAYGQTGTGKTYTMEGGGKKAKNGEFPSDSGVIPRAVRQIFETLEAQSAEYSMKVTCLELYNEEITDLLAPDEFPRPFDDKSKKPIALMEDGKGGVFVRGLEEEIVCSANEIYTLLERGSSKRRTAETLLNKQSSRSHCIFSITIHIKEVTPEGEELIKCGKLNLVDLAGSENISRSGAREGRAREAGEINKSLLTLGRVITALVEHLGHIPYRDSKLTRLLRDSLGGKTKTCIIATVSPSVHCLDETLSTLDYAHRAKSIKNKPEVNQKMMKSALIKDLYSEIDRLKQEVHAAREKNGIYLPRERFLQDEAEKKAMTEKMEQMETEMEAKDKQIEELQGLYESQKLQSADLCNKLEITGKKLEDTEYALNDLEEKHRQLNYMLKEKEFIISNLLQSEKAIVEQTCGIRSELENTAQDVSGLFAKIERKDKVETGNKVLVQTFRSQLIEELEVLHKIVEDSANQQQQHLTTMEEHMQSFVSTKTDATEELRSGVEKLKTIYDFGMKGLHDLASALDGSSLSTFVELNTTVSMHASTLENLLGKAVLDAESLLSELHGTLSKQECTMASYAEQQREAIQRTVDSTRVISKINIDFFATLEKHASKLNCFVEDMQRVHDKKLEDLEKRYQECAVNEEKQLLDKFAKMLASSTARKSQLVQSAVHDLRENTVNNTRELQEGMSNMRHDTSGVQNQWNIYMKQVETDYVEDTTSVTRGHSSMKETVQECMAKTTAAGVQWKSAQESVQKLEKSNIEAVASIIKSGTEANQLILANSTHSLSSTNVEFQTGNKNLMSSIDCLLELDHEICTNIQSTLAPCSNEFIRLRKIHYGEVEKISKEAHKYLEEEYMEDRPSCTTPRRRPINIPSMALIEELQTPFDELLQEFQKMKSENRLKQANGELKHLVSDFSSMRESRIPLTAIN